MAEVYKPMVSPVSSMSSRPLDPSRCKAGVSGRERWSAYSQCVRKAGEDGWCKQHHPDAEAKRLAAQRERYEADVRKVAMGWYGETFLTALVKIADGDNNPRLTAMEALSVCRYRPLPPPPTGEKI